MSTTSHPEPPLVAWIRGIAFHITLVIGTLMWAYILFLPTLSLIALELVTPKSFHASATRPILHTIATFVFSGWSCFVGRLLVFFFGLKYHGVSILNNSPNKAKNKASAKNDNSDNDATSFGNPQLMLAKALSAPPPGKINVIVMNHRTVLDWLIFWGALAQCDAGTAYQSLKIVPKAVLAEIPVFGWAMQLFRFLFLTRKSTEGDLATLAAAAESYCLEPSNSSCGPSVLIFPEGTDLSAVHIQKSQEFAKKNNLPIWNKVLTPRALGLGFFLQSIGKDRLHQLIDITIAYEDYVLGERPGEMSLVKGRAPQAQICAIRRFACDPKFLENDSTIFPLPDFCVNDSVVDTSDAPNTFKVNPKFDKFVLGIFALKEEILTSYYREREEEKNMLISLESPTRKNTDTNKDNDNNNNAKQYSQVFTDYPELGIRSDKDELWLPVSELRVQTFQGFLQKVVPPFLVPVLVGLVNYFYIGFWLSFISIVASVAAMVLLRYVILKKPIHTYFFNQYLEPISTDQKKKKN